MITTHDGYILLKKSDHPNRNSDNNIQEHRLVYEHYLKILFDKDVYIPKEIEIHHINENRQDNSLINLTPLTKEKHNKLHHIKDMSDRYCLLCDSNETYIDKNNYQHWIKYNNEFICKSCFGKERYRNNKEKLLIQSKIYRQKNKKIIKIKDQERYKNKYRLIKKQLRGMI